MPMDEANEVNEDGEEKKPLEGEAEEGEGMTPETSEEEEIPETPEEEEPQM